jgi:hypothetical protein
LALLFSLFRGERPRTALDRPVRHADGRLEQAQAYLISAEGAHSMVRATLDGDRTEFPVMNAEETTIAVESELTVDRMASRLDRLEPRAVDFAG